MAKRDKSRQKKFDTRIDFTPMVDMNMLLITFFMLCTTMIKSQTLQIALPTNEKVEQQDKNQAAESEAITILIDGKLDKAWDGTAISKSAGKAYYFQGKVEEPIAKGEIKLGTGENSIRQLLAKNNKEVIAEVNKLKEQWKHGTLPDSIYQKKAAEARANENYKRPVVMIKATPNASYADVVNVLDEMQINNISRFQIERISATDSTILKELGAF